MKARPTVLVSPHAVFRQVAESLPPEIAQHVVIIGSLAAAVHFFQDEPESEVRTKDIDCLFSPHLRALAAAAHATGLLMEAGWVLRTDGDWAGPGGVETPDEQLPVPRLRPTDETPWFIELLGSPEPRQAPERRFQRLETDLGHFVLCSYKYLALVEHEPIDADYGLRIARPEMMALANLLHHPLIRPDTMSGLIEGRRIRRSNKDLGRVVTLAYLAERREEGTLEYWPGYWLNALQATFPNSWQALARRAGSGLKQLLDPIHASDFDEAWYTCVNGLLARQRLDKNAFRSVGERLMTEVIETLESLVRHR